MPAHRPRKGQKAIRVSYRAHYLLLSAMIVSNLAVFGLALLFTHTLLGEGLGYFVYLNEVKRLLNSQRVGASEQYAHGIDLDYNSFEKTWSEGALVVHPTNPNILFRGTWGGGISKSSDGGRTWEYKNNGLATRYVGDIQFDPSNPSTMYAMTVSHLWSNGGGLYRSVDGGDYWEQVPGVIGGGTPFNINPCGIGEGVAIDPTNSSRLYIAMGINGCDVKGKLCGGFYSSEDAGETFRANPGCQGQVVTNVYRSNDASIVRVHPTRTNEVYIAPGWGLHPEEESLATSHDYGATVKYENVVDTRGSFLSSTEQYVMSLYPKFFDWAKANPEIRYAVHGGELQKRRSDGKVLTIGCCGSGWDTDVGEVIVQYAGDHSQSLQDGINDNDVDNDPTADNIWKPIFATSLLPKLNPSWGGNYQTDYYTQSLMVDPVDPNKIYFTTYGWSMYVLAIDIWELTPGATPTDPWNFRAIYENRLTYPNLSSVRSITFDPSNRYRMYFVEMPWVPGVSPAAAVSYVKKLESSDNGQTWQATTLASDYPYFHATDIKEFQTSNGSVIVMGSTNKLWAYTGGTWQPRSSLWSSPQGFTFTSPVQSPHDPDSIYVKGPRFVAQSTDGARTFGFKQLDEIYYGLGESHPNATAPDTCNGPVWTAPVLTTTVFNALAVHPQDANTLFAGADNGLWKNVQAHPSGALCYGPSSVVNASLAWTHMASTGFGNSFIWSLVFDPADATGATLWAGTRDGLYKSTDGGSTWRPALQNIKDVRQIEFGSGYMLIATLNGTYRSIDNGTNWNRVITQPTNRISHRLGNQLDWAAATNNGIWKSNDGGFSWRQITAAFSGPIDAVLYTTSASGLERFYYTGNGSGLYHTDIILSDIASPSAPTNLTATPTSQTQINLNWGASTDDTGVAGYVILRSQTQGTGYAQIATANANTFTDQNLTSGTSYYYIVRAFDGAGNYSPNSNEASIAPHEIQPPTAPISVQAQAILPTQISLTWDASTDNIGVTGYSIRRSSSAAGPFSDVGVATGTSFDDTGLTQDTLYYYVVWAHDAAGNTSANSSIASARTPVAASFSDTESPTTPGDVRIQQTDTFEISISWTASSDTFGVTGYIVLRSLVSGSGYAILGSTDQTAYIDGSFNPNTRYYYTVQAYDDADNISPQSIATSIMTQAVSSSLPPSPTNLSASSVTASKVLLQWSKRRTVIGTGSGIVGYRVYRNGQQIATIPDNTTYEDAGVASQTTYRYIVRSYNEVETLSLASNEISVTTPSSCGNGTVDTGEQCDGTALSGASCTSQGYSGGNLTCLSSCQFDRSQCTQGTVCGNGIVESGEQCDGINLNTASCVTQGFTTGVLSCSSSCSFNTGACTRSSAVSGAQGGGGNTSTNTNANINTNQSVNTNTNSTSQQSTIQQSQQQTGLSTVGNTNLTPEQIKATVDAAKARMQVISWDLVNRLLGRILLQVESKGEAWYVEPIMKARYYLANGNEAYQALRAFGLGITNADIVKIPVGIEPRFNDIDTDGDGLPDKMEEGLGTNINDPDTDHDGYLDGAEVLNGFNPNGPGELPFDSSLQSRLLGRIVIQTEERGQAWYIDPVDGKRYYMKNGEAAYQIMRFLSLGIKNSDLDQIGAESLR